MRRLDQLRASVVEQMPEALENGVLYIAPEYRIAMHLCCCGCGEEVATPIGDTEYRIQLDGERATVFPSVGNHDFACRSHYIIKAGRIVWAGEMSREDIDAGRAYDRLLKRPGKAQRRSWMGRAVDWLRRLVF